MILKVSVTDEAEARLKERAAAAGVNIETYAARLLETLASPAPSMVELSGPAYEEFLSSGMTDEELGDLLERAKHEMRAERRRRQAS